MGTRTNVMMQEAAPVEEVVVPPFDSKKFAESLPGITGPLGFFDPLGFCTSGDLGFDPMGLKPTDPKEFAEMQTKELNNGRLAMIAIAGMVVQEGVTGAKLF